MKDICLYYKELQAACNQTVVSFLSLDCLAAAFGLELPSAREVTK